MLCCSNWALDPAKMNRGVFVCRYDPTNEDLLTTARGIAHGHPKLQRILAPLSNSYCQVYASMQPKPGEYAPCASHACLDTRIYRASLSGCLARITGSARAYSLSYFKFLVHMMHAEAPRAAVYTSAVCKFKIRSTQFHNYRICIAIYEACSLGYLGRLLCISCCDQSSCRCNAMPEKNLQPCLCVHVHRPLCMSCSDVFFPLQCHAYTNLQHTLGG